VKRFLALPVLAAVVLALTPATASSRGFSYGVTAGEVTSSSAILWTRSDRAARVVLQVSSSKRFKRRRTKSYRLRARTRNDLTVQRRVTRLKAGKRYYFRFLRGRNRSARGTFRTAPKASSTATVKFGWTGDTDASSAPGQTQPYWNNFDVFRRMQAERSDFNIHFGDTIYSDSEVPGRLNPVALTVPQKWAKYKTNLGQRKLQRLRGSAGFYSHWDDHEFVNDFSRQENSFSSAPNVNGETLYRAGVKAFRDYSPVSYTSADGLYRTRRWGRNLELFFLDQRSFRSAKADVGTSCNNPMTGQADQAPTAPQSVRDVFGALLPAFRAPVSAQCLATIRDPNRTYLGKRQLNRFLSAIKNSNARFKVIMNELPISQYYALPYDRWEGYEAERQQVLRYLKANVKNVVFLTTDVHATLVADARLKTLEPGGPENSGIRDITVGPAATANFELEIDDATGRVGNGRLVDDVFLEGTPPAGAGLECSELKTFSYGVVEATSSRLTITPKDINGQPLKQDPSPPGGTTACGPFVLNYQP
jgi:phosphodiesterase/alkaline phosphatase D-like protein